MRIIGTVARFAWLLGAAWLIAWMGNGDTMDTIMMFALLDISTKVQS